MDYEITEEMVQEQIEYAQKMHTKALNEFYRELFEELANESR